VWFALLMEVCTDGCRLWWLSLRQVAMKTNQLGVFYWEDALPITTLLEEAGTIEGGAFLAAWRALPAETSMRLELTISDIEAAKGRLAGINLFVLAHRPVSAASRRVSSSTYEY